MKADTLPRPPDILIVLLDTVRRSDFLEGSDAVGDLPNCRRVRQQSIAFPRAATVAPWSLPSHTSLLSGRYPWETGIHAHGSMRVGPQTPLLPSVLKSAGYRSISLSANGFNSPLFGLTRGFDYAAWGEWWERYLRLPGRTVPNASSNGRPERGIVGRWFNTLADAGVQYFHRYPILLHDVVRVAQKLVNPGQPYDPAWSSWIEPTLEHWIQEVPPDVPVFAFVVLMDAHEPYLVETDGFRAFGEWRHSFAVRSDRSNAVIRRWIPSQDQLTTLHRQYRLMLSVIDRRIGRLVSAFERAGRWENCMMVLASDHGQAFGERGHLFHFIESNEPLLRIPLWVRLPGGALGGRTGRGWASLVDVFPTILKSVGIPGAPSSSGYALGEMVEQERPGPAYAFADGVLPREAVRSNSPPDLLERIDHPTMVAYEENWKIVYSPRIQKFSVFDIDRDPEEKLDLGTADRFPHIQRSLESIAVQLTGKSPLSESAEVDERLKSWGYG